MIIKGNNKSRHIRQAKSISYVTAGDRGRIIFNLDLFLEEIMQRFYALIILTFTLYNNSEFDVTEICENLI